jgi:hypothetical protein
VQTREQIAGTADSYARAHATLLDLLDAMTG